MTDTRWLKEYERTARESDLAAFVVALEPSPRQWLITYPARVFNPGGHPISKPEQPEDVLTDPQPRKQA